MPVLGKIKAIVAQARIENMGVGESGFIEIYEAVVTKKAIFIDIFSEVYEDDDETLPLLPVKRLGPGLTSRDFEIDYSGIDEDNMPYLDTYATYLYLMKDPEHYIIFEDFDLEYYTIFDKKTHDHEVKNDAPQDVFSLKEQLKQAEDVENYKLAAQLRDKIKLIKSKKSKK